MDVNIRDGFYSFPLIKAPSGLCLSDGGKKLLWQREQVVLLPDILYVEVERWKSLLYFFFLRGRRNLKALCHFDQLEQEQSTQRLKGFTSNTRSANKLNLKTKRLPSEHRPRHFSQHVLLSACSQCVEEVQIGGQCESQSSAAAHLGQRESTLLPVKRGPTVPSSFHFNCLISHCYLQTPQSALQQIHPYTYRK